MTANNSNPANVAKMRSGPDDAELMTAFCQGNASAFEALYKRYRKSLYRYVQGVAGKDADDAFQETWLRIIRGRQTWQAEKPFAPWLFTIARNTVNERQRKRDVVADWAENTGLTANHTIEPEAVRSAEQQAKWLRGCLESLPPSQRDVFLLKENSGLSLDDISLIVNEEYDTVKSRLRYAVQKLRECLDPIWGSLA